MPSVPETRCRKSVDGRHDSRAPVTAPPRFVCPKCRGELTSSSGGHHCRRCSAAYPMPLGISDFRVAPDPWIGIEEDRAKGARLEAATAGAGFEATLRVYWTMTPETTRDQADRFVAHVTGAAQRSREWLDGLPSAPHGPWLDLGCGTADVASAAPSDVSVTSVDVAFRWLVAARKRLNEAGRVAQVACCNAEALPFPDCSFVHVLSLGMLEHTSAPDAVFAEARRVLAKGGVLRLRTVNRYSLLPEPHVNVWGVGFVPRRWADSYVRAMSGRRYLHHRPCSPREIRAGLRRAGFTNIRVTPARLLPTERARLPPSTRGLARVYEAARRRPLVASVAAWVVPLLDVCGTAP